MRIDACRAWIRDNIDSSIRIMDHSLDIRLIDGCADVPKYNLTWVKCQESADGDN